MFPYFFYGLDHLLVWLLTASVMISLRMSLFELQQPNPIVFPDGTSRPKPAYSEASVGPLRSRFVMILLDDLNKNVFDQYRGQSSTLDRISSKNGLWGSVYKDVSYPGLSGLEPFFTGNMEGYGPGSLSDFHKVTFIGESQHVPSLRLPKNHTKKLVIKEPVVKKHRGVYSVGRAVTGQFRSVLKSGMFQEHSEALIVYYNTQKTSTNVNGKTASSKAMLDDIFLSLDTIINKTEDSNRMKLLTFIITSTAERAPFIAWGSDIKSMSPGEYTFEINDTLDDRIEPDQSVKSPTFISVTDIAPLISCLLGKSPPLNSVGKFPHALTGMTDRQRGTCQLRTLNGLKYYYHEIVGTLKDGGILRLIDLYPEVISYSNIESKLSEINDNVDDGSRVDVDGMCDSLADEIIRAIYSFKNHRSNFLASLVSFTLLGSIVFCITFLSPMFGSNPDDPDLNLNPPWRCPAFKIVPPVDAVFTVISVIMIAIVASDGLPLQYYFYVVCTVAPWWLGVRNANYILALTSLCTNDYSGEYMCLVFESVFYLFTTIFIGILISNEISILWIYVPSMTLMCLISHVYRTSSHYPMWLFTMLPTITAISYSSLTSDAYTVPFLASVCWVGFSWLAAYMVGIKNTDLPILNINTIFAGAIAFGTASVDVWMSHVVWSVLLFIPSIGSRCLPMRVIQNLLSLGVPIMLICQSAELLGLLVLIVHAVFWICAETHIDFTNMASDAIAPPIINFEINQLSFRHNYFYNMYCCMSLWILKPDVKEFTGTFLQWLYETFMWYEMKIALTVIALTILYTYMTRKTGTSRYQCVLSTYLFFAISGLYSYSGIQRNTWQLSPPQPDEYEPLSKLVCVWGYSLFASWISDLLLSPAIVFWSTDEFSF